MRHLTDTRKITRAWMEEFFPLCDSLRDEGSGASLAGRSMYCLFYEPSFLTRTSFERAMSLLGGHVQFTEDASQFFPVRTKSYIEDTIKFLASLHFDAVVLRSSQVGAVEAAAEADVIPVIAAVAIWTTLRKPYWTSTPFNENWERLMVSRLEWLAG